MTVGWFIAIVIINLLLSWVMLWFYHRNLEKKVASFNQQLREMEEIVAAVMEEIEILTEAKDESESEIEMVDIQEEEETASAPLPLQPRLPAGFTGERTGSEFYLPNEPPLENTAYTKYTVYQLWEQGLPVEEIARRLGTGLNEVQLAIKFGKRS
jgi:hypothetical protein